MNTRTQTPRFEIKNKIDLMRAQQLRDTHQAELNERKPGQWPKADAWQNNLLEELDHAIANYK